MYWLPSINNDISVTFKWFKRSARQILTDGTLVSSWVVHFIVPNSLRPVHGLIEHHELHSLLLHHLLLHASIILIVLSLVHLTVVEIVGTSHSSILVLNHTSTRMVLKVTLLLISFDGNVSIDTIEVLFLLRKHLCCFF